MRSKPRWENLTGRKKRLGHRQFLKAEEFKKELRYFDIKVQKRILFTCSTSIPHVMKDPLTRKQPAANCGLGNTACQLDASSVDCVDVFGLQQRSWTDRCVSSKPCESYKREDVSLCFLSPYLDVIRSSCITLACYITEYNCSLCG